MSGWKGLPSWLAMLLVTAVAIVWLATTSFPIMDKSQVLSSAELPPVSEGHELVQTIKAPGNTISRIDLILGKPYADADGELRFELVEVTSAEGSGTLQLGETLREVTLDTGKFDYLSRHSFEFESLDVTPGKTYAIRLTSDAPADSAVRPNGWTVDNYSGGQVYVDGVPTGSDLYLGIFHDAGAGEILDKMKPWRPFPTNNSYFIVGLFLAGAAAFGWLLWVVAGGRVSGQEEEKPEG